MNQDLGVTVGVKGETTAANVYRSLNREHPEAEVEVKVIISYYDTEDNKQHTITNSVSTEGHKTTISVSGVDNAA